jgi:hypothetical protein
MSEGKNPLGSVITTNAENLTELLKSVRYRKGNPRQYRANAKEGNFNLNGETVLGETAKIHPIAYRQFTGEVFNRKKAWLELFFVDAVGNIGSMMFNGFSVEHFEKFRDNLYYEGVDLDRTVLEIAWEKRQTSINGQKVTYHIAQFKLVETLEEKVGSILSEFTEHVPVYREDTIENCDIVKTLNYPLDVLSLQEGKVITIEKEGQKVDVVSGEQVAQMQAS